MTTAAAREPVPTHRADEERALAEAVEALRGRLLAEPPPPIDEVRLELRRVAGLALGLYGEPAEAGARPQIDPR